MQAWEEDSLPKLEHKIFSDANVAMRYILITVNPSVLCTPSLLTLTTNLQQ